jgi:hypothetical protein
MSDGFILMALKAVLIDGLMAYDSVQYSLT